MIHIRLLGGASIETKDGPLAGRGVQRRRVALLAILAAARGVPVTRDRVIALIWPDAGDQKARHLLSVALHEMRRLLGEEAIRSTGDSLALNRDLVRADVAEFDAAIADRRYEDAAQLYAGPFLDGFHLSDAAEFERWVDTERDRLADAYKRALETAATASAASGNAQGALEWWRRLAATDPFNGRVALQLMHALEAGGDRAAAIRHAHIHETLLRTELEVEPDPSVRALAEQLRAAPPAPPPTPALVPAAAAAAAVAPLATPDAPRALSPSAGAKPRAVDPRRRTFTRVRRAQTVAAALTALFVLAAVFLFNRWTPVGPRTLVVLPLMDLSGDADNAYFADELTAELIRALGEIDSLRVAARTTSFAYKRAAKDTRTIANELNVRYLLEGSVRRAGDNLKVDIALIDGRADRQLWQESYDEAFSNVFDVQEDIARQVARKLRLSLLGQTDAPALVHRVDSEVYDLYLRGRYQWERRTLHSIHEAIQLYRQAIARDSTYAAPWAGLADAYVLLGAHDYGMMAPDEAHPRALDAAKRALELDPELPEAHASIGFVLMNYRYEWRRAEAEFRRAIEQRPGYGQARHWYSLLLAATGRHDEAMAQIDTARTNEPYASVLMASRARHLYFRRDYDNARREFLKTLSYDSTFTTARVGLGLVLAVADSPVAALREYDVIASNPRVSLPLIVALRGHAHARAGQKADARAMLALLHERARTEYVAAEYFAIVHTGLGEIDEAITWIERARANHSGAIAYLAVEPLIDPLRGHPRFQRLLRDVGLRQY
ncbi:MAG TPA: BTAD domain-containing putative transcriptional regulator [Longimicrobiales bacterium]|nr:BTAD domain-containing putative transcriptional regulator [Longimicrobiales bacterium]